MRSIATQTDSAAIDAMGELRERLLATAAQALEIRAVARQARRTSAEARSEAAGLRERSEELRRLSCKLRDEVFAYAAAQRAFGRTAAAAIESARDIADNARRDVGSTIQVERAERVELEGELVLATIDAYLAA